MHDGLRRGCATGMYCFIGHVKFPKLQTGILVEWKAPLVFSKQPYPCTLAVTGSEHWALFKFSYSTALHVVYLL